MRGGSGPRAVDQRPPRGRGSDRSSARRERVFVQQPVRLYVERNEELMVAESHASLVRAIERSQELRAARDAIGLPDGND